MQFVNSTTASHPGCLLLG